MSIYIQTNPVSPYHLSNINFSYTLTCNWFINPEKFGIPKDTVIKVYNDHNNLQVKHTPQLNNLIKVTYIQDSKSESELSNLLNVISIFNQLNSALLTIYCEEDYSVLLKIYSNEHIHFIQKFADVQKDISIETDVIITYGPGVIHFIKQQIPVIIIGPYGLGGWITPDNFQYLFRSGFVGRAGGTLSEYIPVEILAHELLTIKECNDLSSILLVNKEFADELPFKPLSAGKEILEENAELRKRLTDLQARWQLFPFVASNIMFEQTNGTVVIKRKLINDTLCTISREDMPFFKAINGKTNCQDLHKTSQMDEDDFWETMYSLNDKKIILF